MRRYLDHTADLRAEIGAADYGSLLGEAAALVREILVGASAVEPRAELRIALATGEPGEDLFRFVRELLFLADRDGFLPAAARVGAGGAIVTGERFDAARHALERQVKAVTRHQYSCARGPEGWRASLVFDL